jgi:hypothetical protein
MERAFNSVFFAEDNLKRILTYLCNMRQPGSNDPVTGTVLDLLTSKLQFCLSATGLIPFKGHAELVYPYHMMSVDQKDYIRQALQNRASYIVCNDAVVFHQKDQGKCDKLDPIEVLEAMCCQVLQSKIHAEHSVRVGVCNILLQRVQSVVPISKGVQQRLNAVLFG